MTYDATTDDLIAGLRDLAQTEVNLALADLLGGGDVDTFPAIQETRGFPVILDLLENQALPCLVVFVEREQILSQGRYRDRLLTIVFEYVGPGTPIGKLDLRWPLLRKVWNALVRAIYVGKVNGTSVYSKLGVQRVFEESPAVEYNFVAQDGGTTYPHFLGRIQFHWRPTVVTSYQDLLELGASCNRVDQTASVPLQPQVQSFALTPEGELAVIGSDDPFDPSYSGEA